MKMQNASLDIGNNGSNTSLTNNGSNMVPINKSVQLYRKPSYNTSLSVHNQLVAQQMSLGQDNSSHNTMVVNEGPVPDQHQMVSQQLMLNKLAQEEVLNRQRAFNIDASSQGTGRKLKNNALRKAYSGTISTDHFSMLRNKVVIERTEA